MPVELWLMVAAHLDLSSLSAFSSTSRGFHHLFASALLPRYIGKARSEQDRVDRISELFVHAARTDSTRILDQLTTEYRSVVNFVGLIPCYRLGLQYATFLDFALAADAPQVARHLVKVGCNDLAVLRSCTGLKPLALALAGCYGASPSLTTAESALQTAIDFALPRTARVLLTRVADVNAKAGGVREPLLHARSWDKWHKGRFQVPIKVPTPRDTRDPFCQRSVAQAVATLLEFGARTDTRTPPAMLAHSCTHRCWRSSTCRYGGQTPLHLAAASDYAPVIPLLLARDPAAFHAPDDGGYTALYTALVRGNLDGVLALLDDPSAPGPNPAITSNASNPSRDTPRNSTTALHVAARFRLLPAPCAHCLKRGADPNALDGSYGRPHARARGAAAGV
ncbi:predicted protein [Chaetomium globosum CBS 148.51]|uniref:Uncharacterized protein n=1 Tax=Chaetomium globosum (strain ATCC 6205 / CBS 148.51 / DSM 1962 / NBRC 6347 / NRRL 1970) TaxID=306901 RepID=Q2GUH9_CHAGB|nr:uncharacterized protein CHGG_08375 [Chaetomium globosum CBS 148.51]EAQ84361.1 predicted protein [Chaetomium globosum CBS 148.51]